MATRRGWDGRLLRKVDGLALDGWTAAEILRELEEGVRSGSLTADRVPNIRAIERWVKAIQPKDPSGRWRLSVADAEDAEFLLAARAAVMSSTEGRVREVSVATAAWLRVIHAVAADLAPIWAYRFARLYQVRVERKADTGDLDALVGFGPWRSEQAAAEYERAVDAGWVVRSPTTIDMNLPTRVVLVAGDPPTADGEPHLHGGLDWVGVLAEGMDADPGPDRASGGDDR
jgi:hypothetical protein